jgi:hypothetical protein
MYWYFHVPNFILAALFYTLLGRLLLSFFAPRDWNNYIWRAFCRLTEPVLKLTRLVTPSVVPQPVLIIFSALWIMVVRISYWILLRNLDLAPPVT